MDAPRLLVVQGLYRFARNPVCGRGERDFRAGSLLQVQLVAVYGAVVVLGFNLFVLRYEEPTLQRLFGRQYQEYCTRVPRWIRRLRRG